MSMAQTDVATPRKPLRLWPGVAAVAVQWLVGFGLPIFAPEAGGTAILVRLGCGLVVIAWWLFFSRAPWLERVGAITLMVVALFATSRLIHESIANGMMGFMLVVYAIPILSLALVAWAAASRGLASGPRRASMAAAILLACTTLTLIRTNGLTGDADSDFEWRWTPTPEERLLAGSGTSLTPAPAPTLEPQQQPDQKSDERVGAARDELPVSTPAPAVAETIATPEPLWPGFRGPGRDSIVRGVRVETDWTRSPPVEVWRRPIGPGWSSFAVSGDRFFTQEQRGDDEVVSAYSLKTGDPVWSHRDAARFWESNAGAGPRATPTLGHGRVYTLGATGILNALNVRDGAVIWSRNAVSDTRATVPDWGIASSPLVVGDIVIAATAGSLAAYDAATGKPRWFGPTGGRGYGSPHLATIDGVPQIVLLNGTGVIGVAPADGTVLWKHEWSSDGILQPVVIDGGDLLIGSGSGVTDKTGTLRVSVARESGGWTVKERWTSTGFKPYFNDFVVHAGHAFGFDGSILACMDLNDGTRKWKGGRYGHGQLLLLADQDVLLVLSEDGELALVMAGSDKFIELARFRALEGKTWNHPVLVGDRLLVRNGEEMAAFRVPLPPR
jgi:outer membrane protein assembly factor BamB